MLFGLLVFAAIVLIVFSLAATYNSLVAAAERTNRAWAELENLLRQRHDELPKLIEFCEPHLPQAGLERLLATRAAILEARQKRNAAALGSAERALRSELRSVLAQAAAVPALGPSAAFNLLRQRHATLDSEISERREGYNFAVVEHNAAISRPPGSIVAVLGAFRPLQRLELEGTQETPRLPAG